MKFPSIMNEVTADPVFFALVTVAVLVVLFVLYLGAWKLITGSVLGAVNMVLSWFMYCTGFFAVVEFVATVAGTPDRRADHLAWAVIMTAMTLGNAFYYAILNDDSTPGGRFLKTLKP